MMHAFLCNYKRPFSGSYSGNILDSVQFNYEKTYNGYIVQVDTTVEIS